ncbi:MAG: abortive infection family protein, partial [Planctomycetota bacterium]
SRFPKEVAIVGSGLLAIVDGIGALRTHASSAHGAGKKQYKLEPRHARLAIHGAHAVAPFILESWQREQ